MDLGSAAALATILGIPIALIGWFITSGFKKFSNTHIRGDNAAVGDISSANNSIALGHNASIIIRDGARPSTDVELKSLDRSDVNVHDVKLELGETWSCRDRDDLENITFQFASITESEIFQGTKNPCVEVSFSSSPVGCGKYVSRKSEYDFIIPARNNRYFLADYSVFSYVFSSNTFVFTGVGVYNVNHYAKTANFVIVTADCRSSR